MTNSNTGRVDEKRQALLYQSKLDAQEVLEMIK